MFSYGMWMRFWKGPGTPWITNQEEFDKLPDNFKDYTEIYIIGELKEVKRELGNCRLYVSDSAKIDYVYGSAKAGMTAFLSGLRNRLAGKGVRVVTVLPGFVRTRMTAAMKLPGPLTAEPEEVGQAIYRAAELRPRDVIYVRPVWRLVMFVIRSIPESIFKRLRL